MIDVFRDRLMIPIYDVSGHVIAFGGRVLPKKDPNAKPDPRKYLNSQDTLVFHKSYNLFNLNNAKNHVRELDEVIVVEGYFDVIMLFQKGVRNVVAPLGTALTDGHISLLQRYTKHIVLIFDPDPAGEKATWNTIERLLEKGFRIKVLRLPFDMDPFDYLNNHEVGTFLELKEKAPDVFTYMVHFLKEKMDINTLNGKLKMLFYIFKYMVRLTNAVEIDFIYQLLAKELAVSIESLKLEFDKYRKDPKNFVKTVAPVQVVKPAEDPKDRFQANIEREFLILLMEDNTRIDEVRNLFLPNDFSDPVARKIFDQILALHDKKATFTMDDLFNFINDPEINSVITEIVFSERLKTPEGYTDPKKIKDELYVDYRNKLHGRKLKKLIQLIKDRITAAEKSNDVQLLQDLQKDLAAAVSQRNAMKKTKDII
jgi:DNA primase